MQRKGAEKFQGGEVESTLMSLRSRIAAALLTVLLALPLAGQQSKAPPRQDDGPQYVIRARSELVIVPVTVKDATGALVGDIRADEFRILEDGVEQVISVYSVEAFPLSVVVLLDASLDTKEAGLLQKSLPTIAAGFSEADEVALMEFDEYPRAVLSFSRDNDALHTHLKRMVVGSSFPGVGSGPMTAGPRTSQGQIEPKVSTKASTSSGKFTKNLDDAVYAAARLLRDRGRERRKIIFLISDGENSRRNDVSREEVMRMLLSADISVYAVSMNPVPLSNIRNPLYRYAKDTGGDIFHGKSVAEMETIYSRVTEQARNQYTLAYAPQSTDRSKEYHSIEVRVKRGNLRILARDGYYAAPQP
jgi:VWFA-related protein